MFTDMLPKIVFDTDTVARIELCGNAISIAFKDGNTTDVFIYDDIELLSKFDALSDILLGKNKTKSNISGIEFVDIPYVKPFKLSKTVITQQQWRDTMGTTPWTGKQFVMEGDDYPAVYISWYDAMEFCQRLSVSGKTYRLPTEAEWEFACRGGSTTDFHFGNDESQLGNYAWYWENCRNEQYAHPVAQKLPNQYGLYDMHGNVWEWCQDSFGSSRIIRGGSWSNLGACARSGYRYGNNPGHTHDSTGFRVVAE